MNGYEALVALQSYIRSSYHDFVKDASLKDFKNTNVVVGDADTIKYQDPVVLFLMTGEGETLYDDTDVSTSSDSANQNIKICIVIKDASEEKMQRDIFYYVALLRHCLYEQTTFDYIRINSYACFAQFNESDRQDKRYGILDLNVRYEETLTI